MPDKIKLTTKIAATFDRIIEIFAVLAAILLIFLMLLVCAEVVMRYFFNMPIQGVLELSEYSLLFISFLPAIWILRKEGHTKIDIVLLMLSPKAQKVINIITTVLCALASLILAWYGFKIALEHFSLNIRLSTLLMPPSYLIISIIPIAYLLLFIQLIRRAVGFATGTSLPLKRSTE
jgi:TRAP-type C4-dicarboxylate transport system permease small subunit